MTDSSTHKDSSDVLPLRIGRFEVLHDGRFTPWGESYVVNDGALTGRLNLFAPWLSQDPSFRASFEQMAPSMVNLEHPSLGRNYEFGISDGRLYTVEEEFAGTSIREISRLLDACVSVTPISVRRTAISLCSALDAVHRLTYPNGDPIHLVYRAPLPGRIFFTPKGDIKLSAPIPWSSVWLNLNRYQVEDRETHFFRAPEEFKEGKAYIHHDLYALARCLLSMLRPAPPHSPLKRAEQYVQESLKNLHEIDPDFAQVLDKALSKSPEDRFQTASAMKDALAPLTSDELEQSNAEVQQFITETRSNTRKNAEALARSVRNIADVQRRLRPASTTDTTQEILRRRAFTVDIPISKAPTRSEVRRQTPTHPEPSAQSAFPATAGAFDAPPPVSRRPPQRTPTPTSLPGVITPPHRPKK